MPFWTYILHCRGGAFYTGHTDDLDRRIASHRSGEIPGFTRNHLPIELVWSQEFSGRYEALTAERQIKGWSRKKKLALIRGDWDAVSFHARSKDIPSTGSGRTELWVSPDICNLLLEEAGSTHPRECCGLLLGTGNRIERITPAANVHLQPLMHFEIDPKALIAAHKAMRAGGPEIVGYYHSHPAGPPEPSATDAAMAAHDGMVWAIAGQGDVRFWRDLPGGFEALCYSQVDS